MISIYLLVILAITTFLVLENYQQIFHTLTQIKYDIHPQRHNESIQTLLTEKLSKQDLRGQSTNCLNQDSIQLCYLSGRESYNDPFFLSKGNYAQKTILIDFNHYQSFNSNCAIHAPARMQSDWQIVHPQSCLALPRALPKKESYYNFNLALENVDLAAEKFWLVNGYVTINQLEVQEDLTIIALGDLIIEDLIFKSNIELTFISLRGQVDIRHYPENMPLYQAPGIWQFAPTQTFLGIDLKLITMIPQSLTVSIPKNQD